MKYLSFSRQDILVLFITVLPFMMVVNFLYLGNAYFIFPDFLWITLIAFLIGTLSWVTHIFTANFLRDTIPNYTKMAKRIIVQIPIYVLLTQTGIGLATYSIFRALGLITPENAWDVYEPIFIACLLLNLIATAFHEGLILFDKWKMSLIEAEQLKKLHLQSQLDSLKNQVNPHFLFNSLNCLSSLITSDQDKACDFLDEMSKVYRYMLRSNENMLVTVENELRFIASYFHLIKTRYGDSIFLEVEIGSEAQRKMIVPLTLQLLVENAVKHNSILKRSPLNIVINTDADGYLQISNNIQPRTSPVLSNKIGLQNIISKYRLMNQPDITILQTAAHFTVRLPLIESES